MQVTQFFRPKKRISFTDDVFPLDISGGERERLFSEQVSDAKSDVTFDEPV